jgi:hypothetical protein
MMFVLTFKGFSKEELLLKQQQDVIKIGDRNESELSQQFKIVNFHLAAFLIGSIK